VVVGNGAAGTLVVIGLLRSAVHREARLRVSWIGDDPPGRGVRANWVINCTGPRADLTATDDPPVRSLLSGGHARPHPLGPPRPRTPTPRRDDARTG
jgi:hypothetical protein